MAIADRAHVVVGRHGAAAAISTILRAPSSSLASSRAARTDKVAACTFATRQANMSRTRPPIGLPGRWPPGADLAQLYHVAQRAYEGPDTIWSRQHLRRRVLLAPPESRKGYMLEAGLLA